MTPIEKLIDVCNRIIKGDRLKDIHLVIELEEAVKEYESAPKLWTPVWRSKIPDWPNIWLTVDSDGEGIWWENESVYPYSNGWGNSEKNRYAAAGYFEIPDGIDWRDMKIQVKKDGKMVVNTKKDEVS